MLARMEPYRQVVERALEHLRRAGDRSGTLDVLATIAHSVTVGPMPIPEAIARMEAILDEASESRELRARVRVRMGFVLAQQGAEREALEAEAEADAILEDLGVEFFFGSYGLMAGELEGFLGRFGRAEQLLRRSDAIFERAGEQSVRSTVLAVLAGVLVDDGRMAEAEEAARLGLELGSSDDLATLVHAHRALGRVLGSRGDPRAEETARRAVTIAEETDLLCQQGETWNDLGLILLSQGRDEEAEEALRNSVDRFERKGATALANRVRARIS
jgi:tetratricopeptide (TPR) repeat protein